ncbi:unannotated protein [freshwater metagenome]|uniref:Unannotated protein n=1 Tax=freshwater metagenome TaxID=449393 RepID=A0A6J6KBE0_9ZZZZ
MKIFQNQPGLHELIAKWCRPVDEIEVDLVEPQEIEAGLEGLRGSLTALV